MKRDLVKYETGLRLAKNGIRTFAEAARRLGISPAHLSNILACRETPAAAQLGLARLCQCRPSDLFGEHTNPELIALEGAGQCDFGKTAERKESA